MGEVEKVINARGRKMLGWDEILEGNPTKTSTVMAWTGVKAGIKFHKFSDAEFAELYKLTQPVRDEFNKQIPAELTKMIADTQK